MQIHNYDYINEIVKVWQQAAVSFNLPSHQMRSITDRILHMLDFNVCCSTQNEVKYDARMLAEARAFLRASEYGRVKSSRSGSDSSPFLEVIHPPLVCHRLFYLFTYCLFHYIFASTLRFPLIVCGRCWYSVKPLAFLKCTLVAHHCSITSCVPSRVMI